MSSGARPNGRTRQEILYADQIWRQQRFFAGFLVVVGVFWLVVLAYQGQMAKVAAAIATAVEKGQLLALGPAVWLAYIPLGLSLGGFFLLYKRRSFVEPTDGGVRVSTMRYSVLIDYDDIRNVRVQPLKNAFMDSRSRMIAPMIKPLLEKPALFIKVRLDDDQGAVVQRRLGRRMMYEDTIALPVRDADTVAWAINARLPERLGQNQGGARRRKKRR